MKNNKTVICIPSYGFRYVELFDALKEITEYDIKIFISNDDDRINDYKSLGIDIINTSAKNIAEKRKFIVDWTIENNYDYAFIIEDDVKSYGYKITSETKRPTSKTYKRIRVPIKEAIDVLYNRTIEYNATFSSLIRNAFLGFSHPGNVKVNKSLNCGQFICYNVNDIKNNNISIYTDVLFPEDVKFCMDILMKGLTCICVADYTYIENSSNKSVIFSDTIDRSMIHILFAKMYNCPLTIDAQGIIRPVIKFNKYFNIDKLPPYKKNVEDKYRTLFNMFDAGESYENLLNYLKTEILKKN